MRDRLRRFPALTILANIEKRLVRSPKVYFRDSGLLHYFLGIGSAADLDVHPAPEEESPAQQTGFQ